MIEIVCDGMAATKSYTREAVDIKSAMQISQRHIRNDPDNWVVIRNAKSSYMIMQEGNYKFGLYEMHTGSCLEEEEDLGNAVSKCWKYLTEK